jgi:tetratricopeptide (TPR) repeat protein
MKRSILKSGLFLTGAMSVLVFNSYRSYAQAPLDLNAATSFTRSEAYDKAAEIFKQLIQKEPGNSKYYFFYGENWLQDYFADTISNSLSVFTKEAKALYEKGVSSDPNEPLNYVGLAKVAFYNNDNKTADEMRAKAKSFLLPYKNIKKMVPPAKDYAFTLAKLAESYITADFGVDTAKALPFILEAIKIDSKNEDIYLIAGDIYNLRNDGSNAIKYYNLAQEYNPTSPTANMKIGSIYVKAKTLGAAIPKFEEAIQLNANYAPAYRELGALYAMAGRYDQSKQNFQKYLELTKDNIPAKISYVRSLYYAGEYDDVIKRIEEIFAVDKSKAYLNRLAAYSSYDKKNADYDKALTYMETLFKTVSPELIIKRDYQYLARILLKKNQNYPFLVRDNERLKTQLERESARYAGATTAAEKAKLKPGVDSLTARIARLNRQIKIADVDIDRAFGEYAKRLSYDPEDKALLTEIANSYYTYTRFDAAAKTWAKLIALGKNDIKDYMQLGRWYLNAEKYEAADSVMNLVLKMDPKYVEAYLNIARISSKTEGDAKVGLARPKFEKVIEIASADSSKNISALSEAFRYLGNHYMLNDNYMKAKEYFTRMTTLDAGNKDFKTIGYSGLGQVETLIVNNEKTNEGRLSYLSKAREWYNKILIYDPGNESAKASLNYVQAYEKNVIAGINPNELRGTVKDASGQPVVNASIRVKDTAAETYTNATGSFKFEIPQASEALVITAKGFKTKEIPVTRPLRPQNIVLEQ